MEWILRTGWWSPGLAYLVLFAIQTSLIVPIEAELLGQQAYVASYLFLPAGLKLLSYYLFRYRALPSLIIGTYVAHTLMYQSGEGHELAALVGSITSAMALPVLHEIAKVVGVDLFRDYRMQPPHWTHLLIISASAALISGVGFVFSWSLIEPGFVGLNLVPRFMIGDTLGAFAFLLITMFIARQSRTAA